MILRRLKIKQFRAHADTDLEPGAKINLITGPNGAGKTNILEAVYFCCLSKSFVTSHDQYLIQKDQEFSEIVGAFEGNRRKDLEIKVVLTRHEGKRVFINRAPLERLTDLVGKAPIVVLSPGDYELSAGGPEERRRFLDNILSQARPVYLSDLVNYRRTVRQRNELLNTLKRGARRENQDLLHSWTQELVETGSRIIQSRMEFLASFVHHLERAFLLMEELREIPILHYQTIGDISIHHTEEDIKRLFEKKLERFGQRELELGRTMVGPHLDEIVFKLDQFEIRKYASQGQHRTFVMGLKLAQFFYLKDRLDEVPILLLDDAFVSLDRSRMRMFLNLLLSEETDQVIISAADRNAIAEWVDFGLPENRIFDVSNGSVISSL